MTQPNATIPTLPPTSDGVCEACRATLPLYGEYERRRSIPSDIVDHLPELYHWARGWHFAHIVELGTRSGNSTSAFLAGVEADRRGHVWSFDLDQAQVPDSWHGSEYWTFTRADALSPAALAAAPAGIEVLFIDLDPHSFDQTLAALSLWAPRVVPGGVILCHDTEWPEVNYVRPGAAESGVGRALDVYAGLHGLEWRNKSGCNGLGIMRIRGDA